MHKQSSTAEGVRRSIRKHWSRLEARYQIVFACFLATFTAYVERVGFSIAFTAMAKEAQIGEGIKGTVLSAFFWGYAVSQVPGGWAAQRWGGQRTLGTSFALWSTASLLTPKDARRTSAIVGVRVMVGIAQGLVIPSIHTVLSQWIPPHERARAVSLTTSGMYLGSAAAMLILPALADAFGPASLLRVVGLVGLAWLFLWTLVGKEVPHRLAVMPLSSNDEKGTRMKGRPPATPWAKMMRHPAVWAIILNNFTFHYAFYVVMNWQPTYFDQVLHSELSSLGSLRTAPYLVMFASSNFGGWLGDTLIVGQQYSVAAARKVVNSIGFWGTAMALLCMPLAWGKFSGLLIMSWLLGMAGFSRGGFSVNHMDIAPKYAGPLMGISNTAGTLAGVVGVAATGWMIENAGQGLRGWWHAFSTSAFLCTAGSFVFLACAAGERIFSDSDQF